MAATILSIDTIVSDPQLRGGRPTIKGRRITVSDLVAGHLRMSPEELATQFKLTLGQVYAALAYYYMHKAEIDEEMRLDRETAERLKVELERQGKLGHLD